MSSSTFYPLKHRVAIITGANQGLGLAIARAYVQAGASLMICARNGDLLAQAKTELQQLAPLAEQGQLILAEVANVSRRTEVENLVDSALRTFPQIHVLVNNAAVHGPKGEIADIDWDEWVNAIEINLFGSVLFCRALVPHFKAHAYGKIIQVSGGGATKPFPRVSAYAASKAAIVRFAETLAEEVRADHIDVNSVAPGALNTRLTDDILAAGPDKVGQELYNRTMKQKAQGGEPIEQATALAVFLGAAQSDGITGKLISAVWDPWETLADHQDDLQQSDVYTLRRIVPKDRGLSWGER